MSDYHYNSVLLYVRYEVKHFVLPHLMFTTTLPDDKHVTGKGSDVQRE